MRVSDDDLRLLLPQSDRVLEALLAVRHDPQRLVRLYEQAAELLSGFAAGDLSKIDQFEAVAEARFVAEKCLVAWVRRLVMPTPAGIPTL